MKSNSLPVLLGLVVVLGGAGLWLSQSRQATPDAVANNEPLIAGLADQLNDVKALRIRGASGALIADVQRTEQGWVVANRGNYPANFGKVREYLLKLSESRLREAKTASPERHARLGVEDLSGADAKGAGVQLEGLGKPVDLIVGTFNATSGQGYFVRHADQSQVWLANGNIRPDTTLTQWLATDIANVGSQRIVRAEITPPSGAPVRIQKADPSEPDYTVLDLPRGRELSSPSIGNGIATLFDNLTLEDVSPASEAVVPEEGVYRARYMTVEGLQVDVTGWEADGKSLLQLSASLDPERQAGWLQQEQAMAEMLHLQQTKVSAPTPAEGEAASPAVPTAPAPFDADAFRKSKLEPLQQELDGINARTKGWTYAIPSWKFAHLKKSMDDLLKAK